MICREKSIKSESEKIAEEGHEFALSMAFFSTLLGFLYGRKQAY